MAVSGTVRTQNHAHEISEATSVPASPRAVTALMVGFRF